MIDQYVLSLIGHAVPADTPKAPTDADSRIAALEQHVAALTVATGNASSAIMSASKATAAATAAAAASAPSA
jgi:O-acetylhomoserine/O-acetylserine sulfhydrylase-like pyridoxal-dependent enzyme